MGVGERHPSTLAYLNNLAVLLKKQGRLEEAEEYYRLSLEGRKQALGEAHPVTKQSMNNLAMLLKVKEKMIDKLRAGEAADSGTLGADEAVNTVNREEHSSSPAVGVTKRGSMSKKTPSAVVEKKSGKANGSVKGKL